MLWNVQNTSPFQNALECLCLTTQPIFGHQKMVVMSKYGMRFLNTVIKIRFDCSEHSSILLTYGAFHFLQMCVCLISINMPPSELDFAPQTGKTCSQSSCKIAAGYTVNMLFCKYVDMWGAPVRNMAKLAWPRKQCIGWTYTTMAQVWLLLKSVEGSEGSVLLARRRMCGDHALSLQVVCQWHGVQGQ